MNCRLCFSPETFPVPFPLPSNEPPFVRCVRCGSDSSPFDYSDLRKHYTTEACEGHESNGGGPASMQEYCRINCEWFERAGVGDLPKTFLDVGSCDGSALENMRNLGWDVQGFDVLRPHHERHPVLVGESFSANLFPGTFSAVLSREVVEHVPDPHQHIRELAAACSEGGLVQVQTPRPYWEWNPNPYQTLHLCVIAPLVLQKMLADAGLIPVDRMIWDTGQAYLCRKQALPASLTA